MRVSFLARITFIASCLVNCFPEQKRNCGECWSPLRWEGPRPNEIGDEIPGPGASLNRWARDSDAADGRYSAPSRSSCDAVRPRALQTRRGYPGNFTRVGFIPSPLSHVPPRRAEGCRPPLALSTGLSLARIPQVSLGPWDPVPIASGNWFGADSMQQSQKMTRLTSWLLRYISTR